jgi:uncharacterized membrane protein YecN with MAPEG domain
LPLLLMFVWLSFRVIRHRRSARVALGSGGDARLERAIRAHANFAEYVPFAVLLLVLAELGGAWPVLLHGLGALLVVAGLTPPMTPEATLRAALGALGAVEASFSSAD